MGLKKNMVLFGINSNEKGVLTIEKNDDIFEGRIRLYNFKEEPKGILSLGFYIEGKTIKAGLSHVSNMLYTFKTEGLNFPNDFSCAVVNMYQGKTTPILYGNTKGTKKEDIKLADVAVKIFDKPICVSQVKKVLDENNIDFEENLKQEIEKEIDKNLEEDLNEKCKNCKYRKCFFEEENQKIEQKTTKNDEKSEKNEQFSKKTPHFYEEIKPQIDSLFEKGEREDFLENIIPSSKWVKIEYENNGDYYIIGLIYEKDDLKYLCYGVPGIYQKNPPKELAGYPVWLPLDKTKPQSFGYWLSYQDIDTGESIKAVIE